MRADRLVAALLLLQTRGRVTAAELARELEVSVATARRDLEALSAAGVPVYPQAGRGGGWQLVGGARTDLTGLTAGEARALFLLLGPGTGSTPAARAALRKLLRALPQTFRADAEAAAGAVVVDAAAWGGREQRVPAVVVRLQDAVVHRQEVRLTYRGAGGARERLVEPWGLADKDGTWYLLAGTADGRRTFRTDRVEDAVATGRTVERPAGLDLAAAWREVVEEVEGRRSRVAATVLADARDVPLLQRSFGRHCTVEGEAPDGRLRLRLTAHLAVSLAEQLAGWGARVEVVEPAEVRAHLVRIGEELLRHRR